LDDFSLAGKRALVVGTASSVERAIIDALAEAGARVRVGNLDGVETVVPDAVAELGGLDVVVSCGDLRMAGPFEELADQEWEGLVAVNLTAPVRLLRAAGREMLARDGGKIICIVSVLGERGLPHTAAYGACQAGLIQLIRALSLEWARRNVRINGIGLGWFEGDPLLPNPLAPSPEGKGESPSPSGEGLGERVTRYLPTRRLGRPEEVGALAVYLASDAADMMTGQTIFVDGAVMAHA